MILHDIERRLFPSFSKLSLPCAVLVQCEMYCCGANGIICGSRKCAYVQVWVFEPVGALFGLGCWSSSLRWRNQHFAPVLHPLLRKTQNGWYHLSQVLSFRQPPFLVTVTRRSIVSSSRLVLVLCNGRLLVLEKAVDGLVESVLAVGYLFLLCHCFGRRALDVHCLRPPFLPSPFLEGTTGIALSFMRPVSFLAMCELPVADLPGCL